MDSSMFKNQKFRFFRVLLFIAAFSTLAGISTYTWFKLDPISFRQLAFEPIRDSLYFYRELQPITGWRCLETQPDFNSQRVEIPARQINDPTLVADLWEPENHKKKPYPAVLILHGSSHLGRRQGLVRVFAHHFQKFGWIVLTPDARGFGESENPKVIHDPESWQIATDINRTIDFLYQFPEVDKNKIFLLGHSMGAADALEGAFSDPRVTALILIGPPRYFSGNQTSLWKRVRFSSDRKLRHVISERVILENIEMGDIARYAYEGRLRDNLRPILLLDGEFEKEKEKLFLKTISTYLSESSSYYTVPGVGHYCGVYHIPGTEIILWRRDFFQACMQPIKVFLDNFFYESR
jgi:pimeloyl-ACP methyl ester carboxylesterase